MASIVIENPPVSPIVTDANAGSNLHFQFDTNNFAESDNDSNSSSLDEPIEIIETDYGGAEYWDKRYDAYSPFDWLMTWSHFKDQNLNSFIKHSDTILMLGCGSAAFSADMYDDGYTNIVNIDLSSVVIEQMQFASQERTEMTWEVMNCTDLKYENESFDVCFDKSTMDCIYCCDNSTHQISEFMCEAWRVLKPGGLFICLSLHAPEKTLPYIVSNEKDNEFDWSTMEKFLIPNPKYEEGTQKAESYLCVVAIKPATSTDAVRKNRGVRAPTLLKFMEGGGGGE